VIAEDAVAWSVAAPTEAIGAIRIEKESRQDVNALRLQREFRGINNFIYWTLKAAVGFLS
jgi:hypothetical protein